MDRRALRQVAAVQAWWQGTIGGRGWARVRELDLDTHALAFSAQQVLCTAPLVVAISSILQRTSGHDVSVVIARFFGLHGRSEAAVGSLFARSAMATVSTSALVVGLITAVLFTTSVAAVQQRAFELIWGQQRASGVRSYVRNLVWVPGLAVFIAALLGAGRLGRALDGGPFVSIPLQALVTFGFYWWTQHWLLGGRVSWRSLLPGALVVAVLTVATVRLSRLIIDGQITWQVDAYGLLGAAFVLSVWLGVFSAVVYAGVLFGALFVEGRRVVADSVADGTADRLADELADDLDAALVGDSPEPVGQVR